MKEIDMTITVTGKTKRYIFDIRVDPQYLDEWREQGLELDHVGMRIPAWVVHAGFTIPYCRMVRALRWITFK